MASFLSNVTGGSGDKNKQSSEQEKQSGGGGGGSFADKINNMAGGGAQGEKNEDALDKAVDLVQEKLLGQGDQSNESAAEQAKDEAISDFIRGKYKDVTGRDMPIKDKDKKYGV